MTENKTWLEIAEMEVETLSSLDMYNIISKLNEKFRSGKFEEVDNQLQLADLRNMCPEAIMASCRATAVARHKLPSWSHFRDRCFQEMQIRTGSIDILRGLESI